MIQTTTFSAPDIECGGCANSIKTALAKVEGIQQVDVDINEKTVAVKHDSPATKDVILARLDAIGFPATVTATP